MHRGQNYRSHAAVKFESFQHVGEDHPWWNQTHDILSGRPPLGTFVTLLICHEENIFLAVAVDLYNNRIKKTTVRKRQ